MSLAVSRNRRRHFVLPAGGKVFGAEAVARPEAVQPLLRPCPSEALAAYPVGLLVNNPRNDKPECLKPAG